MAKIKNFKTIRKKWLDDASVRKEYDSIKEEFQIAEEIIRARARAGMTQAELAEKIGTKAPAISRLESPGYGRASIAALKKVAHALNCELDVKFVPKKEDKKRRAG
ncbi:MAG: helix-turn-helix transcriptional regulator [Thermodesulfobacteriota bacterium]|nr:MAG: helix-turn-helix transcriptional regulator [Thermodesulfobacteriota bacterium]